MPEPFDLENLPPDASNRPSSGGQPPLGQPAPLRGQLPTTRASDLLKSRGGGKTINSAYGGQSNKPEGPDVDRRATPLDDPASGLFAICSIVFLVGLGYLLWGMWSGAFASPNWTTVYTHDDRARAFANISLAGNIMWWVLSIATLMFLFLFYHEEYCGYSLLAGGIFLQVAVPYITTALYGFMNLVPSGATTNIFGLLQAQSWVIGIPGLILTLFNIYRATVSGLEEAKVKRKHLQFGQKAINDPKPRSQFLGPCWNLPYCKDSIRGKCPIYIKKQGPCWRNKRGCMCDQTILLLASAPNWKQNVAATVDKLDGKIGGRVMPELPPQPQLSHAAKVERCRQCVIFNLHQEQKYKLVVGVVLAGTLGSVIFYNSQLLNGIGYFFTSANLLIGRFSTSTTVTPLYPHGAPPLVEWAILVAAVLVVIANILQVAEWWCFKLKA